MSKYLIELKNGKKLGLDVRGGNLSCSVTDRRDEFQEIVNRILYQAKPKDRKVRDWEMMDTEEEWEAVGIENQHTVSGPPAKAKLGPGGVCDRFEHERFAGSAAEEADPICVNCGSYKSVHK